jgi:hypothetical protein
MKIIRSTEAYQYQYTMRPHIGKALILVVTPQSQGIEQHEVPPGKLVVYLVGVAVLVVEAMKLSSKTIVEQLVDISYPAKLVLVVEPY